MHVYNNNNAETVNFVVRKVNFMVSEMCGTGEEEKDSRLLLVLKGFFHKNGLRGCFLP